MPKRRVAEADQRRLVPQLLQEMICRHVGGDDHGQEKASPGKAGRGRGVT